MAKKVSLNINELLDEYMSTSPENMEKAREQADKMLEFSNKIINIIAEYAKNTVDYDKWATSMLMGVARATSIAIRVLEEASKDPDAKIMEYYTEHILPLCDAVTSTHELLKKANNLDTN